MSYFEASFQASGVAAGAAFCGLLNPAAAGKPRLRLVELTFTTNAATLSQVGLVRALTLGTPSLTLAGQPTDDLDTTVPVGGIVTGWSAQPTIAGTPAYLRQFVAAAVAGAGIPWSWPGDRPLVVSPGGGLLLWNFGGSAGSALSGYAVWEE